MYKCLQGLLVPVSEAPAHQTEYRFLFSVARRPKYESRFDPENFSYQLGTLPCSVRLLTLGPYLKLQKGLNSSLLALTVRPLFTTLLFFIEIGICRGLRRKITNVYAQFYFTLFFHLNQKKDLFGNNPKVNSNHSRQFSFVLSHTQRRSLDYCSRTATTHSLA